MKKFRIITALLMILSFVFLCTGCTPDLSKYENTDVRLQTEAMLDALIADDASAGYALLPEGICTESEFAETFGKMRQMLGDSDHYGLNLLYTQVTTSVTNTGNSKRIFATYDMKCDAGRFVVDIAVDENLDILTFYVTPYEKTDYYLTGTLDTMQDANAVQWVFLLLNIIPLGVTVFAFVDCCRKKIRKKVLWLLLLIFGFFAFGLTLSSSMVRINFNLGLASVYTALLRYGSGTMVVRFMVPAGAIAYFIARKSLLEKKPPQPPFPEMENSLPPFPPQGGTAETDTPQPEQMTDRN